MADLQQLILFPAGGNAREAIAVVEAINGVGERWELLGFIDDDPSLQGQEMLGYPILGGRTCLPDFSAAKVLAVPGRAANFSSRDRVIASLGISRDRFASLVHPRASLGAETTIGHNTLIMAGVVATVGVTIGSHCVILPNTVISHDARIGDYSLVGSNVSISGSVEIERQCYIGSGAKLIQEIIVGSGSLVGLGSVVIASIAPNTVVAGNPARALRQVCAS